MSASGFADSPGENPIRYHFRNQALACERLGSAFTGLLCRELADCLDQSSRTGARVLGWRGHAGSDALALRLCAALHALVLSGADAELAAVYPPNEPDGERLRDLLPRILARHDDRLAAMLDSAPQTNEIARSAMLLPGFLMIARETGLPLDLNEIGSSAGLNLNFDRFHYVYRDRRWGDAGSPVRLAPAVHGAAPPLDGRLQITSRTGCDIAPIDIADPSTRLRLRSYVWADQPERLARLDAAIALALLEPFTVLASDAADFVSEQLAGRRQGHVFVLFHSIMWQYLPEAAKAAIEKEMEEAGATASAEAPIAWLRMEPLSTRDPCALLSLTSWPGGKTRHLAKCDYHGRWMEWQGTPGADVGRPLPGIGRPRL